MMDQKQGNRSSFKSVPKRRLHHAVAGGLAIALALLGYAQRAVLEETFDRLADWALSDRASRGTTTFTTEIGTSQRDTLADGSTIELNTSTHVEVKINDQRRQVTIVQGEALLDIKEDRKRTFHLHAGPAEIETHSARILARRQEDGATRVTMLAGYGWLRPVADRAGRYDASSSPILMKAGQTALVRPGRRIITGFQPTQADHLLAWTQGEVVLEGLTLREAAAEFNRYNTRKIVIADGSIEELKVGGRFRTEDVDHFTRGLEMVTDVRIVPGRDATGAIVLVGRGWSEI